MIAQCPLCTENAASLLETLKTADLINAYKMFMKLDPSNEFHGLEETSFYHCGKCDLMFFSPMITPSASFYEQLQKNEWYYLDDKEEYDFASKYVNGTSSVLEIGAGKGAFSGKIQTDKYVGLEYNKNAVKLASLSGIRLLIQSIDEYATGNSGSFDVVCAFQVLEHVSDIRSFISNCISCLKPGGILIYSVPSADSFIGLLQNYVLNLPPHHQSWWSDNCLRAIAELFHLELVSVFHEKLADTHTRLYASAVIHESLRSLFGLKFSLTDLTVRHRLVSAIAYVGSMLLEKGLRDHHMRPSGHTVTVVYRKPTSHPSGHLE